MKVLKIFENAKKKNRLSHLYLLASKAGVNKENLIYDICHLILKDYDKKDNLLELITNHSHSQVHIVEPEGDVIKKSQIINLQDVFSKTSLVDAPRIYVIKDVDLISVSAANGLLKFMEEPDNDLVYGLLTTSNQSNVLPTILSRAQIIRIPYNNENIVFKELEDEDVELYHLKLISLLTKDLNEAKDMIYNANLIEVFDFVKEYFTNYNDFSIIDLSKINNIIVDRNLYKILVELLLLNYEELLKHYFKEEVFLDEVVNEDTIKLDKDYLLKNINLLKSELIKQTAYININLSLDLLILKLRKEV